MTPPSGGRARPRSLPALLILAWLLLAAPATAQRWSIDDPGQGPFTLAPGAAAAHELSGLAWQDGDRYLAVSDDDGALFRLRIDIDPRSGAIRSAAVQDSLRLAGATDLEGVVAVPGGRVVVADETGPSLREFDAATGRRLREAALPRVFAGHRHNLGFEALARERDGTLWTANEEALRPDGPTSTAAAGTLVRLLRLDADLRPTGQWAYRTDPITGAQLLPGRGTGLSELVALPDGRLLALERSFGTGGLRIRLYEVEIGAATETGAIASLADARVVPVTRHLLWERAGVRDNFEGAALGPPLADGSRSLVLVSDDGHGQAQSLYALRLRAR